MKYFVLGVIVLGILLGICLLSALQCVRWIDALEQPLYEAYPALCSRDWESAQPLVEEAAAQWEQCRRFLGCTRAHSELDAVDEGFCRLRAYLCTEDLPELCAVYAELCERLDHLRRSDLPYYYNLL